MDDWILKRELCVYNGMLFDFNKSLFFFFVIVTTWINLEDIIVAEIIQAQRDKDHMYSITLESEKTKLRSRKENGLSESVLSANGERDMMTNRHKYSIKLEV